MTALVRGGTGLSIFMKRLKRYRFAAFWREGDGLVELTARELALFIEGCTVVGRVPRSPPLLVL